MRSSAGHILVVCAGLALGQAWTLAGAPQKAASGCTTPAKMPDESFQTLAGGGLRDAVVWVDDIDSGLSGRFSPFQVYVVTGKVYAPFQLRQGKLGRDAFRRLVAGNYNAVLHGPLVISTAARQGQQAFTQDGRTFSLRVLGVEASTFNRDTVTIQLCW